MKLIVRATLAFLLMCALLSVAKADRLSTIRIIGTDSFCTSFTPSAGGGANILTCVPPASPPPSAPTGCTATVNGSSTLSLPSTGGQAVLAVSGCTPSSGLSYNWSKNGAPGISVAASWTDTLPVNNSTTVDNNYSYQVRVCVVSACVTVPASPLAVLVPKNGGGGWDGSHCPGFTNTVVIDKTSNGRTDNVSMGPNDVVVVKFTTLNADSANNNLPTISAAEWNSSPSGRLAVLSATPCDFSPQTWPGATSSGNSVQVPFAVGAGSGWNYYPILNKSTMYYFNIKMFNQAQSCISVGGGVCTLFVELEYPGF